MDVRSLLLYGRKRLRPVAIVGAAASVLSLGMVTLPSATPAWAASCPSGHICAWRDSNYSGTQWNYAGNSFQPAGYWWYVGSAANDQISSIWVNLPSTQRAWLDGYCIAVSDEETWMPAGSKAPNLANNNWLGSVGRYDMNDSITSWAITSASGSPAHGSSTNGGC
ncbi:MAG TPA: peptidase inhibitor family I36 protein [Rugosimonospora sp.]|nr:peptidase inhibitor family I36 protein [Rugosimonospora sp.]